VVLETGMTNKRRSNSAMAVISAPGRWLNNIVSIQEKKEYNFYVILLFSCFVGLTRFMLESIFSRPVIIQNVYVINMIVFYLQAVFVYALILRIFVPKQKWQKSINIVLIGVFLGIFPPAIDLFIYGLGNFTENYSRSFPHDWNLLLYNESIHFTYGETITLFLTMFFTSTVVFVKTRNILKTVASFVVAYGLVVVMVQVLSTVAYLVINTDKTFPMNLSQGGTPAAADYLRLIGLSYPVILSLFQLLLIVVIYLVLNPHLATNLAKRLNHALPAGLTCLMGYTLDRQLDWPGVIISMFFFFAFVVAIVQNDYFDRIEDEIEGRAAYVGRNDVSFFNTILLVIIVLLVITGTMTGYYLLLFAVVSFLYNYDFYRAKKYFPSNNKIEGIFGVSAFLGGLTMAFTVDTRLAFVMAPAAGGMPRPIQELWTVSAIIITFLVFGGWFLISIFKDYKDIRGDLAAGNQTVYTMLRKRNRDERRFHRIYSLILFALLLIPPIWLGVSGVVPLIPLWMGLVDVFLVVVINLKNSRKGIELGFLAINIYLLLAVIGNHLLHAGFPAQ
jgi:4-hydroxybenzoate polyprenyltransferase